MKKSQMSRRAELREQMQREVENNLISQGELERVAGSFIADTDQDTCKCWCATGYLSTCHAGTVQ
ncbi:MAG TPA: hypothetical protein VF173_36525 [Thermoanaerobaculia bacterium]|nr:hypothetical protein [Thermoanaerobaculia bacterium]